MWCTEVAGGAFLTFLIVVSGDISDHGRLPIRAISGCSFLRRANSSTVDENTRIQTAFEEGEARGEARVRIELIKTLEELLRMEISSDAELRGKSLEELQQRAQLLQEVIRNCPSS